MATAKLFKNLCFSVKILAASLVFTCAFSTLAHAAPRTAELVADAETGRILRGENINSPRHPASLTKVMTLYLTFAALEQGRIRLDDYMPVSWNAASQQPSRLGLDEGSRIKVRDAIYGLVTESANDAAVVLSEAIGGTEDRFAYLMTQQARALGMKHTTYRNANGLHDPEQVTTAYDQAILARAMLFHFPQYYKFFRTRTFTYDGVSHRNHNRLMSRYEGMDGIKTGYVRASGFNLIASAKRNNHRLIGVVFGGRSAVSRDNHMADILDGSFQQLYAEAQPSAKKYGMIPVTDPVVKADATNDTADIATDTSAQGDAETADTAPVAASPNAKADDENVVSDAPVVASTKKKGTWAVQVGTFNSRKASLRAIKQAKVRAASDLKNASMKIVSAKTGRKTIYRARLTGISEASARSACGALSDKGLTCLTLPPNG